MKWTPSSDGGPLTAGQQRRKPRPPAAPRPAPAAGGRGSSPLTFIYFILFFYIHSTVKAG